MRKDRFLVSLDMPDRVRQFDIARPSTRLRWWARNDSGCMKDSGKAGIPMSAMLQRTSPRRASGKAAQAERTPATRVSRSFIQSLNRIARHSGTHNRQQPLRIAAQLEPATIINRAYEERLHGCYRWPGYGW